MNDQQQQLDKVLHVLDQLVNILIDVNDRLQAIDDKQEQTDKLLSTFIHAGPTPTLNERPPSPVPQKPTAADNTILCTELRITNDGGNMYYKIAGANSQTGEDYHKFGIRIWPEILQRAGIQPAAYGTQSLAGWIGTFTRKANGQPDKIVLLERGNGAVAPELPVTDYESLMKAHLSDGRKGSIGWIAAASSIFGLSHNEIKERLKKANINAISRNSKERISLARQIFEDILSE